MRSYETVRRWRLAHPEEAKRRARNADLKRFYGITLAEYEALAEAQGWRCAICRQTSERTLHVDHDHRTGQVRGLLCGTCNRGMGMLGDDAALLQRAADYVRNG